jgi:hypothetical protein
LRGCGRRVPAGRPSAGRGRLPFANELGELWHQPDLITRDRGSPLGLSDQIVNVMNDRWAMAKPGWIRGRRRLRSMNTVPHTAHALPSLQSGADGRGPVRRAACADTAWAAYDCATAALGGQRTSIQDSEHYRRA